MRQQLLHAAARHVARRLVAAEEQQQRLEHELVVVEAVAVDLGVHEHAHEIVGRGPRAGPRSGRARILDVLAERLGRGGLSASGPPFNEPSMLVRPAQQVGAVVGRDAEHVADDDHRQRRGEVVPEVALAAFADGVDQFVAERADARLAVAHSRAA